MARFRAKAIVLALAALLAGTGYLWAQSRAEDEIPEVSLPDQDEIPELSSAEMRERAGEVVDAMQAIHEHTVELQSVAREGRDVIKLNCVNDKLLQIKQLLNIAETSRNDLIEAITREDDEARIHHFRQIAVAYGNVKSLREEARGCVGEDAVFLGDTEVEVEGPDIADDPTAEPPFPDVEIEDPTYASPYF